MHGESRHATILSDENPRVRLPARQRTHKKCEAPTLAEPRARRGDNPANPFLDRIASHAAFPGRHLPRSETI